MPNWNSNTLTIRGEKSAILALMERAASGSHDYVGPFNKHDESMDWGSFTPIQMEMLMMDDDLFRDKSETKSVFSFHAFVPVPKHVMLAPYDPNRLKEAAGKYPEWFSRFPDMIAGYDWENSNWGCKWGSSEASLYDQGGSDEDYYVDYTFDTAWAPPMEFMHSLAKLYPTMRFVLSYREDGMGFEGDAEWEGGECTVHDQRDCEEEEEDDGYEEGSEE